MQHIAEESLRAMNPAWICDRKRITAALPRARRFVLSVKASERLGHFIRECEDLVLDNQQFALAPYPVTYIELNCRAAYEAAGKRLWSNGGTRDNDPHADETVGYLIDGRRISVFTRTRAGEFGMGPFQFHDGTGFPSMRFEPVDMPPNAPADSDWLRLATMLGTGLFAISGDDVRRAILARWTLQPAITEPEVYRHFKTAQCSAGDLRNIIAILLLLNQPHVIRLIGQQPRPHIAHGKRVVYAAHNVVEIELGRRREHMRRLFRHWSDRASPRRHEVRGHFAHYRLAEGCTHQWPFMPEAGEDGQPRWRCGACGGWRVWRASHERGDASRGFVTKEYSLIGGDS